jgi:hypothetical protein
MMQLCADFSEGQSGRIEIMSLVNHCNNSDRQLLEGRNEVAAAKAEEALLAVQGPEKDFRDFSAIWGSKGGLRSNYSVLVN